MKDCAKLEELVHRVLSELERLQYSESTVTGFRRIFNAYLKHASECGLEDFSEEDAVCYLNSRFGLTLEHLYQKNPDRTNRKNWLRAMRILMELSECGSICKRMPGDLKRTVLPPGLQSLLDSFNTLSRKNGHSESTIYSRNGRIKHFLLYLAEQGGTDASCINEASAHDYILTKASLHGKSVITILAAIRRFLRAKPSSIRQHSNDEVHKEFQLHCLDKSATLLFAVAGVLFGMLGVVCLN